MSYTIATLDQLRHDFQVQHLNAQIETNILKSFITTSGSGDKVYNFKLLKEGTLVQSALEEVITFHKAKGWSICDFMEVEGTNIINVRFHITTNGNTGGESGGGSGEGTGGGTPDPWETENPDDGRDIDW